MSFELIEHTISFMRLTLTPTTDWATWEPNPFLPLAEELNQSALSIRPQQPICEQNSKKCVDRRSNVSRSIIIRQKIMHDL